MKAVEERTEQIARVHARVFGRKVKNSVRRQRSRNLPVELDGKLVLYKPPPRSSASSGGAAADDDLLERLRRGKRGAKFSALYDRGDWQGQGYPSQSEADLALCTMIASRCAGDAARVDAVFRNSSLMRPKWDESHYADGRTYGEETVDKAVAGHDHSIAPPPTTPTTDALAGGNGRPLMCTDTGNAERLVRRFGEQLRFCHPWKRFLFWDRRRWKEDDRGMAMRYSKDVVRGIYLEAANCENAGLREEISSWAFKSEKVDRRKALVELAKSEPALVVVPDQLDRDPWLLNCANCTLDLRTLAPRPHSRDDHITKLCPVEYHPDAKAPVWEVFLQRVLPDQAIRDFVQRAVGWSLTGDVSEQVFFFLFGLGANGKSVFLSAVLRMLGIDYGIQAAPDLVLTRRFATHPTDLADLFGKRLVATVEVGNGQAFDEVLIKQLTGGDRIRARRMREDFWEFSPTHHIWIAGNHKPIVRGTDYAIWRRILLVPFTVTIPKQERDRKLLEGLAAELPGILAWAIRGCRAWQQQGLNPPDAVLLATEQYRSEMNVVGRFVEERCVRQAGAKSGATELFHAFMRWCVIAGEQPRSQTSFGESMTELGIEKRKIGGSIWYLNVALAGSPGPVGEGRGGAGPNPDINDIRAPREETNKQRGPNSPQPSPSSVDAGSVPREVALGADLSAGRVKPCPACGRSRWWGRPDSALRICAKCHPPASGVEAIYENAPDESGDDQ